MFCRAEVELAEDLTSGRVELLPLTPLKPGHVTGLSVSQHPGSIVVTSPFTSLKASRATWRTGFQKGPGTGRRGRGM
ncbi:hypothetical protein VZT92_008291 [Zoarces viviparus]|uniref:Uncharacterized protein n=1 Tax=Zoarces viviparus TaxID=48416 RepID=A0AAW1FHR5_ZOAVI